MKFLLFPFLYPLSLLTRVLTSLDRRWRSRRAVRLASQVVSVGNITMGGTGKTPWVIKVVRDLQTLGQAPAVLSRGYKGVGRGFGRDSDETMLMMEKCPGVPLGVGPDRKFSAQQIQADHNPSVFVLDDGFQHWPLQRDLDIVCIDATDPWGAGFLLPYGRLREPVCALRRAHAVVITRCDLVPSSELKQIEARIRKVAPHVEVFPSWFMARIWSMQGHQERDSAELKGKRVVAVSGLGHPQGFETSLERFGAVVVPYRFRDHHLYSEQDAVAIEARRKKEDAVLVTTEKDWVKLKNTSLSKTGFVLKIEAMLSDADQNRWTHFLKEKLHEAKTSR